MEQAKIVEITPSDIGEFGVLCGSASLYQEGCHKKMSWYKSRYAEGLRLKAVVDPEGKRVGMIEYVPGEYAWRTINARGYIVIHCLQVFRNQTRKGYGSLLLEDCVKSSVDTNGIAIVTSSKPWVNDANFFLKNGFRRVEKAPPYFELLARSFNEAPLPSFCTGWEERARQFRPGVTVLYSDQCPIIDYAVKNLWGAAAACGLPFQVHKIESAVEAQNAPSPYGTFQILLDGRFLTHRIFDKQQYIKLLKSGREK